MKSWIKNIRIERDTRFLEETSTVRVCSSFRVQDNSPKECKITRWEFDKWKERKNLALKKFKTRKRNWKTTEPKFPKAKQRPPPWISCGKMVRETRHLWVANLPDNTREDRIREHFQRWAYRHCIKPLSSPHYGLVLEQFKENFFVLRVVMRRRDETTFPGFRKLRVFHRIHDASHSSPIPFLSSN